MAAASDQAAKLCGVCSKLDTQHLAHSLYPCSNPLYCPEASIKGARDGHYLALGSREEITNRRSTCDICSLIAECLDKEPSDLDGECRMTEIEKYCSFKLPRNVEAGDSNITHFHITQASVMFDTSTADQFQGPALPWEIKTRLAHLTHYILQFQTRASSYPEPRDSTSTSLQTDVEFLETIGGRNVGTQVNTQLVRSWLRECEHEHVAICTPPTQLVKRYNESAFMVDVIELCIVDTPPQCRYVALSYVWGVPGTVFKHILENTQDLRQPGSLRSLPIPATIRDAMTLVQSIGERYLWVDSLCIIQDELKMQQTEIMRMGSIYSGALFTIIAASGDHADSGLPGIRPGSREQAQKILKLAGCELLTVIDMGNTSGGIDNTVWGQRAWTFQERALSNRVLVFSETQVYWSCRAACYSEERALERVQDIDRLHCPFPQTRASDHLSWKPLPPLEYCNLYDDLLCNYRQRRLTYETDILNAFNGVTEMLSAIQNDSFFWGLPESVFSYAVTWEMTGLTSRNGIDVPVFDSDGTKQMIPIPSWSWAAWSGKDSLHVFLDGRKELVKPLIKFSIVDKKCRVVPIQENEEPDDRVLALRHDAQLESLPQPPLPKIGHLHFWTSHANVKAVRRWNTGARGIAYNLFPPPDFQANPHGALDRSEIVHQDFIVVASHDTDGLILLAIEWKDGVTYRVGRAGVKEADWLRVENRQWRLITLG